MRAMMTKLLATSTALLGGLAASVGVATAQIEQSRSDAGAFSLGTLTPSTGAMSRDLWEGSDTRTVEDLLIGVPVKFDDALHLELLRRVTLSPGEGPSGSDNALAALKFMTAARAGFYEDAVSLAELVPGLRSEPGLSKVAAFGDLMDGNADAACARGAGLASGRTDNFWVKLRFLCYVRAGESSAAELTLTLLRRQDALTEASDRRFVDFWSGVGPSEPYAVDDVIEYAMLRERGVKFTSNIVSTGNSALVAAIARDPNQDPNVRAEALIRSVAQKTIDRSEALRLVDGLTGTTLAADLISVATQGQGTMEQADAISRALLNANADWESLTARAILLAPELRASTPVENYAPQASEIALAGMINGQTAVVERWLLALAADPSTPNAMVQAGDLLRAYAFIDPGAARRIGSYIEVTLDEQPVPPQMITGQGGNFPLASFVSAGLKAADAEGEAPASLVYLMGPAVTSEGDAGAVRDTVVQWAHDRAELGWLDRRAAFRQAAIEFLSGGAAPATGRMVDGVPVPRVKPAGN